MENNTLPEAPASATVKIKSKNGFEYLFTLRESSGTALLGKLELLETDLTNRGYTALSQGNGFGRSKEAKPKSYVEGRVCPLDGGRLIQPEPGSKMPIKCENNKWNPTTKQAYGCKYVEWPSKSTGQQSVPDLDINDIPDFA